MCISSLAFLASSFSSTAGSVSDFAAVADDVCRQGRRESSQLAAWAFALAWGLAFAEALPPEPLRASASA
jgi:hypothetical protein